MAVSTDVACLAIVLAVGLGATGEPGGASSQEVLRLAAIPDITPRAILVDADDRIWIGHDEGIAVVDGGEGGVWRDASSGLNGPVRALHEAAGGVIYGSGYEGAWRWEGDRWALRLPTGTCISPLHLTSQDDFVFGVCSYYPGFVAWHSRPPADGTSDAEDGNFRGGIPHKAAFVDRGEIYVIAGASATEVLRLVSRDLPRDTEAATEVALPDEAGGRRLTDLWSPRPGRLVIVGEAGLVLTLREGSFSVEETGVAEDLLAVWGTEGDGLYAVGLAGRILFRGDEGWSVVPSGTREDLIDVHGRPNGRIVVAGADGSVFEIRPG